MMKKNKTKKLDFKKLNLVELNSDNLNKINGGSEYASQVPIRDSWSIVTIGAELAIN
jgi:hypothetical protein